jgi:hypothetical protein
MTTWTPQELATLGAIAEVEIAPTRGDGTVGPTRPIWVVAVDGQLYVRSYRGPDGAWHRPARRSGRGQITAAGATHDVTLAAVDVDQAAVDAAYRTKYARHGADYVDAMITPSAAATTLRVDPV